MRIWGDTCRADDGTHGQLYADIEPAGSRWLPWPGRVCRWWYEIRCPDHTHAYDPGGSGGGFTLRRCIWAAIEGLEEAI